MNDSTGLAISTKVDYKSYNNSYYSDSHVAYPEGYTLLKRIEKYNDAIENIQNNLSQSVIDLGCGPGFIVFGLSEKGVEVEGVDISDIAINNLSPESIRPRLKRASLTELPYRDGQFNSGYSFHVLEHLTKSEIRVAIPEISRIVKNKLYLIIPTSESLSNPVLYNQIMSDPTHRTIMTRQWWINQFQKEGWYINSEKSDEFDRLKRGWVFFLER